MEWKGRDAKGLEGRRQFGVTNKQWFDYRINYCKQSTAVLLLNRKVKEISIATYHNIGYE